MVCILNVNLADEDSSGRVIEVKADDAVTHSE